MRTVTEISSLPKGFVISQQQQKILLAEREGDFPFQFVGETPRLGVTWGRHLVFEEYVSFEEPVVKPCKKPRIIFWRPLGHSNLPNGWHQFPLKLDLITVTGYSHIKNPEKYWETWDYDARKYREQFLNNNKYDAVEVSLEKFDSDYPRVGKYGAFRPRVMRKIRRYSDVFKEDHHFYELIERKTGKVAAGLSVADHGTANHSFHVSGFVERSFEDPTLGVGTIDHWFNECTKKNVHFIDFDVFWEPGNPKKWQGFSMFKKKFGTKLIYYPKSVARFTWS